jgi:hypothetical protein
VFPTEYEFPSDGVPAGALDPDFCKTIYPAPFVIVLAEEKDSEMDVVERALPEKDAA